VSGHCQRSTEFIKLINVEADEIAKIEAWSLVFSAHIVFLGVYIYIAPFYRISV